MPSRYTSAMRVIAGQYRHRRLIAPPGEQTRPILDRVKASLFDWLGSRLALPGHLPAICVLDLFCGAGSLGIEALSRGARYCAFVESDPQALECLRQNLNAIGIGPEARVFSRAAENVRAAGPDGDGFDLVFVDPPYKLSEDASRDGVMARVVARLGKEISVDTGAHLLWRHDEQCALPAAWPGGWRAVERRAWGNMAITLFARTDEVTP